MFDAKPTAIFFNRVRSVTPTATTNGLTSPLFNTGIMSPAAGSALLSPPPPPALLRFVQQTHVYPADMSAAQRMIALEEEMQVAAAVPAFAGSAFFTPASAPQSLATTLLKVPRAPLALQQTAPSQLHPPLPRKTPAPLANPGNSVSLLAALDGPGDSTTFWAFFERFGENFASYAPVLPGYTEDQLARYYTANKANETFAHHMQKYQARLRLA
jgi:hypothetical protein